jgi:hypothetical protein
VEELFVSWAQAHWPAVVGGAAWLYPVYKVLRWAFPKRPPRELSPLVAELIRSLDDRRVPINTIWNVVGEACTTQVGGYELTIYPKDDSVWGTVRAPNGCMDYLRRFERRALRAAAARRLEWVRELNRNEILYRIRSGG